MVAVQTLFLITTDSPSGLRMALQLLGILLAVLYLVYWRQLARRAGDAVLVRQIPFAVGGGVFVGVLDFLFWGFIYPSRGLQGVEDKLVYAGNAFFYAYQCYLLIWFEAVLRNSARQAYRITFTHGDDGSAVMPIDPPASREDSTSP